MEIIHIHHPNIPEPPSEIVLVLGFFDGVHRGHQAVIQAGRQSADQIELPLAVMTFNQHPKIVHSRLAAGEMDYLSDLPRKMALLEQNGVDYVFLVDFTYPFASQSPQAFVQHYIVGLKARVVVAGFDYTYGPKAVANMQTLPEHAQGRFDIIEVPELVLNQAKIGSSAIRDLILAGRIAEANQCLGYPYETSGVVVHGEKRGRTIGFPTANIQPQVGQVQPGPGIYVVEICVNGHWYQGMASIGYNVTFESSIGLTCEVHIFDFNQYIYGEAVKVRWYHYLRGEIKFDSVEGLIKQLQADQQASEAYFEGKRR